MNRCKPSPLTALPALHPVFIACALANSGGQAKLMVADGLVQVDGQQELRKTAKIRAGQVVSMAGVRIRVEPEEGGMTPPVTGE